MLYKMRHHGAFRGDAVEHTYLEMVHVKGGIAVCKDSRTRDALRVRGYDLIEEIPLDLKEDERIPDKFYMEISETSKRKPKVKRPRRKIKF